MIRWPRVAVAFAGAAAIACGHARPLVSERLAGVPDDIAARSGELARVTCPAGTRLVERATRGHIVFSLHRNCTGGEGAFVEIWSDGRASTLRRYDAHDGVPTGALVVVDRDFVTEAELAGGHPVGAYRRRDRVTGVTVIEGRFDDLGRMDGAWTFRRADTGALLGTSTLAHGTGALVLWAGPLDPTEGEDSVLARSSCVEGRWDGPQEFQLGDRFQELVTAEYRGGIPHGRWRRVRLPGHELVEEGTYDRGRPVGTWRMVAPSVCLHPQEHGVDRGCDVAMSDVPYHCDLAATPPCDYDEPLRSQSIEDGLPSLWPPQPDRRIRRCEIPERYF